LQPSIQIECLTKFPHAGTIFGDHVVESIRHMQFGSPAGAGVRLILLVDIRREHHGLINWNMMSYIRRPRHDCSLLSISKRVPRYKLGGHPRSQEGRKLRVDPYELPLNVRIAFDELRTVRAMTESAILTLSACLNLRREMKAAGFTGEDSAMLACRAVALGNQDAGR
jgi:hypothetical protein